jgi:hypothetical protein
MIWEFFRVAMTIVPDGAVGALNQNGAPAVICPGVQMNCLLIMKVQAWSCTQARTPVRWASTRKPVTSIQALWLKRITMVLPWAWAATAWTACGRAASVSSVLTAVAGAAANAATPSTAAPTASTVPTGAGAACTTASAITSSVMMGAEK